MSRTWDAFCTRAPGAQVEIPRRLGVGLDLDHLGLGDAAGLAEPLDLAQQLVHLADHRRIGEILHHEGAAAGLAHDQPLVHQHVAPPCAW